MKGLEDFVDAVGVFRESRSDVGALFGLEVVGQGLQALQDVGGGRPPLVERSDDFHQSLGDGGVLGAVSGQLPGEDPLQLGGLSSRGELELGLGFSFYIEIVPERLVRQGPHFNDIPKAGGGKLILQDLPDLGAVIPDVLKLLPLEAMAGVGQEKGDHDLADGPKLLVAADLFDDSFFLFFKYHEMGENIQQPGGFEEAIMGFSTSVYSGPRFIFTSTPRALSRLEGPP